MLSPTTCVITSYSIHYTKLYEVRGFYFANDPNDPLFLPQLFTRLGDPRQSGVTMNYRF